MKAQEFLEKLPAEYQAKPVRIEHGKRTKVVFADDAAYLKHNTREWPLEGQLVWDLAKFAGVSESVAKNLTPKVAGLALTELLAAKGEYAIVVKDGKPVTFLETARVPLVEPERLIRLIEQRLGGDGVEFDRALTMHHEALQIEATGLNGDIVIDRSAHVGLQIPDLVRAGVMIQFSPFGTIAPVVSAYTRRQICLNGAMSDIVLAKFTGSGGGGGEGDNVWHFFRQSITAAYKAVKPIIARFQQLADEQIDPADRNVIIEAMIKEAALKPAAADILRRAAIEHPPLNRWQAYNLLTDLTTHRLNDPRQIVRAQRAHAAFAQPGHAVYCSKCGRGSAQGALPEIVVPANQLN